MSANPPSSDSLQPLLTRLAAGDEKAADDLIAHAMECLRRMAHHRLRKNPIPGNPAQTDDVVQAAAVRLYRALKAVKPDTVRHFTNLAATQIRRELLDLYDKHCGPEGDVTNRAPDPGVADSQGIVRPRIEVKSDSGPGPVSLCLVNEMDEQVHALPEEEREVAVRIIYLRMTQDEIAQVLGVSIPTVKRRWSSARLLLREALKFMLPEE